MASVSFSNPEVYVSGIDHARKTANVNVKNCRFITTCKAHGRMTQLKQQILISSPKAVDIIRTAYYIHDF